MNAARPAEPTLPTPARADMIVDLMAIDVEAAILRALRGDRAALDAAEALARDATFSELVAAAELSRVKAEQAEAEAARLLDKDPTLAAQVNAWLACHCNETGPRGGTR